MNSVEVALKERIKELTCLYEVSSILVDADPKEHLQTFQAIADSIKVGFQYPEATEVVIKQGDYKVATGTILTDKYLATKIKVFDEFDGFIKVYLNDESLDFLTEEQPLIDNIGIKIGDYLDRVASKQNAARLRQQMEHADRLAIIGELTAGIAHELNTPLANILGFAELLKDDLEENTAAGADLDKIIKNAIFSREVVKKLMFFSRAMPQEKTLVNIVPQVKEAINLLDATFRKENVRYSVAIEDEEMLLHVDTVQLTQILFNLTINAIYFSPPDGLVQIRVSQDAKNIYLEIFDEGPGLSEEGLEKVFQPFFTTKPTGSGAGLGLSVVHGIVTSHNGSISAKNNETKGAVFKVSLPK